MLYWLGENADNALRLFRYLTFRAAGAATTSMFLVIIFGPWVIKKLKHFRTIAPSRLRGLVPEEELKLEKEKIPSMGGVLIVGSVLISTFLWAPPSNPLVILFTCNMLLFAILGFLDDYQKIARKSKDGLSSKNKFIIQIIISAFSVWFLSTIPSIGSNSGDIMVPFLKEPMIQALPFGLILLFGTLVVTGSSNAVNFTDGLDGLATGCVTACSVTYMVFAYLCSHSKFSEYLNIPFVPGCGEVAVFAAAIAGACIGFLWYNCHPASVFMGDTGSLSLGASIGLIAVLVKQEITLIIVGGIFVVEALSVIIQVSYFKYSGGKRIFLMAPIHHHFEKKGWTETQVVIRFWIIAVVLGAFGLATLKLR